MRYILTLFLSLACYGLDLTPVGAPNCDKGQVLDKTWYVVCYRADWRDAEWVAEHLTAKQVKGTVERKDNFRPDPDLDKADRAELADYSSGAYDRGHQAPAGDFAFSAEAMSQSFLLSNMEPQTPELNRGPWARLEAYVRGLTAKGDVWVVTGPIPGKHLLNKRIMIPAAFWKAVLVIHKDGPTERFDWELPNSSAPGAFESQTISDASLQKQTGLKFFPKVK
jgi:endonuclease G